MMNRIVKYRTPADDPETKWENWWTRREPVYIGSTKIAYRIPENETTTETYLNVNPGRKFIYYPLRRKYAPLLQDPAILFDSLNDIIEIEKVDDKNKFLSLLVRLEKVGALINPKYRVYIQAITRLIEIVDD